MQGRRVDRRVVVKAAAAFAAMAAAGGRSSARRVARAEGATYASTWVEAEAGEGLVEVGEGVLGFAVDHAFTAIAPTWSAEEAGPVTVEIWLSADGASWGGPAIVGAADVDGGRPDRGGRRFGSLVFADGARYVRYRVSDGAGNVVRLPGFAFAVIDSSAGPALADAVGGSGEGEGVWKPPVISRAMWGADESYRYDGNGNELWPPDYQTVSHVIIHHTATPNFRSPLAAVRAIYYYHAVERGWGDIGYNYLVDHMGNVYEGRYGGENVIGGHAYQYAQGSAGIGVLGEFNTRSTTPEAQAGLVWITAWAARGLDPYGADAFHDIPSLPTISGHRDVNDSSCPGDGIYWELPTIRDQVAAVLAGADPTLDPEFFAGDTVRVTVEDANLRSGPGTDFEVRRTLALGTVLSVTDGPTTNGGFTWYAVEDEAGGGWCASSLLERVAPGGGEEAPSLTVGDRVVVATDALNLRTDPGLGSPVLARMPAGTSLTVVAEAIEAEGELWYGVASDEFGEGWCVGRYLARGGSGELTVGQQVRVIDGELNLRDGPGLAGRVVVVLPDGAELEVAAGPERRDGFDWYRVGSEVYGTGWCAGEYLAAV